VFYPRLLSNLVWFLFELNFTKSLWHWLARNLKHEIRPTFSEATKGWVLSFIARAVLLSIESRLGVLHLSIFFLSTLFSSDSSKQVLLVTKNSLPRVASLLARSNVILFFSWRRVKSYVTSLVHF